MEVWSSCGTTTPPPWHLQHVEHVQAIFPLGPDPRSDNLGIAKPKGFIWKALQVLSRFYVNLYGSVGWS